MLPSAKVDSGDRLEKLVIANIDMLERLLQDVASSCEPYTAKLSRAS